MTIIVQSKEYRKEKRKAESALVLVESSIHLVPEELRKRIEMQDVGASLEDREKEHRTKGGRTEREDALPRKCTLDTA